jgi:hypothetical protein
MKPGRVLIGSVVGLLLGFLLYSQGCGDNSTLPVDFEGNVATVETSGATALRAPASEHALLVRLDFDRLRSSVVASAEAQSAACTAATQQRLAGVLACAETTNFVTPVPTTTALATPTGTVTPAATATSRPASSNRVCSPVRSSDCRFSTRIVLSEDGQSVFLFFLQDTNNNGDVDPGERQAFLVSPLPGRLCNGDVLEIPDVDVNFLTSTATAGGFIIKLIDACPAPTSAPTRTPTRTATAGTPAAGTPTATATGTPPTPTASATATATASPTPTSTSPPM